MNDKAANDKKTGGAKPRPAAELQSDLGERDRQLRDLTEQALGFLTELAESRRLNADREQLAGRIGELERMLAETRHRLRHAGGCAPSGAAASTPATAGPALEVVFCGGAALGDAVASIAALGDVPATWIGLPAAMPADALPAPLRALVHRDAHTPAQCFNLGMAATTAKVVLFVGPGHRLDAGPALRSDLPPNVALLAPRIDGPGPAEQGCEDVDGLLRFRPAAAIDGDRSVLVAIAWPSPHAFLVRRAAFDQIGLFDETFAGDAALVDYALRARSRNFDVVGAPGLVVTRPALVPAAEGAAGAADHERLMLLAMHRPQSLGKALADAPQLWGLGPDALPAFLAPILARLPTAEGLGAQRSVLEQVALGLTRQALPLRSLCALLQQQRLELLRGLAIDTVVIHHDEVLAALQVAQEAHFDDPVAAFAALAGDLALARRCAIDAAHALQGSIAERRDLDNDRHAHLARAERAEGARQVTQSQLEQVEAWLREAQAAVQQMHAIDLDRHAWKARAEQTEQAQLAAVEEARQLRAALAAVASAAQLAEASAPEEVRQRVAALAHAAAELETLRQRLADAGRTIDEHERAIASLLQEVQRRRVFPRQLLPHEQALVDRLERAP